MLTSLAMQQEKVAFGGMNAILIAGAAVVELVYHKASQPTVY